MLSGDKGVEDEELRYIKIKAVMADLMYELLNQHHYYTLLLSI